MQYFGESQGESKYKWRVYKCLIRDLLSNVFFSQSSDLLRVLIFRAAGGIRRVQVFNNYPAKSRGISIFRKIEQDKISDEKFPTYVYRRISVIYGWQISSARWPYIGIGRICWIITCDICDICTRYAHYLYSAKLNWHKESIIWSLFRSSVSETYSLDRFLVGLVLLQLAVSLQAKAGGLPEFFPCCEKRVIFLRAAE